MDFIRELLESEKPKKKRKTAAAQTYHRDYVRTKNKPYRKYDPEETNEGYGYEDHEMGDEVDHGAIMSELERIIGELSELLAKYDQCQGGEEGGEMGPEEPEANLGAEPEVTPQFSSWLQKMGGVRLSESASVKKQINEGVLRFAAGFGGSPADLKDLTKNYGGKNASRIYKLIATHFEKQ